MLQVILHRIWLILWFIAYIDYVTCASFCADGNLLCLTSTPSADGQTMSITVTTTASGWAAIGIGSSMRNADIITMYPLQDGSNTVVLEDRVSSSRSRPPLQSQQVSALTAAGPQPDGSWQYTFTRPVQVQSTGSGQKALQNQKMSMIWAVSQQSVQQSGDIQMHSDEGTFQINLFETSGQGQSNGESDGDNDTAAKIAHGIFMFAAWGIVVPLAIFMARYMKNKLHVQWFPWHRNAIIGAVLSTIIGFVIIVAVQGFADISSSSHGIMGVVLVIMMLLQSGLGKYIDMQFNPNRTKIPLHDKAHWYLGWSVWIFALVTMALGANLLAEGVLIAYLIIMAAVLVWFAYFEISVGQSHHSEDTDKIITTSTESFPLEQVRAK